MGEQQKFSPLKQHVMDLFERLGLTYLRSILLYFGTEL